MSVTEILHEAGSYPWKLIEVTGGEPLQQAGSIPLLHVLIQRGYAVTLETSGLDSLTFVPDGVRIIMDVKTPGSGLEKPFLTKNLQRLSRDDAIKFVVCDREDFDWSMNIIDEYHLCGVAPVYLSPSYGELKPRVLAEWILEQHRPLRLNVQLHKILWGDIRGR